MPIIGPANSLYQTKQHYQILDGLRGIAAIAAVIFHFMEFIIPDYNKCFIAHASLAVDSLCLYVAVFKLPGSHEASLNTLMVMVPLFTVLLIGLAYLVLQYIDKPLRSFLLKRNAQKKAVSLAYEVVPAGERKHVDQ